MVSARVASLPQGASWTRRRLSPLNISQKGFVSSPQCSASLLLSLPKLSVSHMLVSDYVFVAQGAAGEAAEASPLNDGQEGFVFEPELSSSSLLSVSEVLTSSQYMRVTGRCWRWRRRRR